MTQDNHGHSKAFFVSSFFLIQGHFLRGSLLQVLPVTTY
ncbi:hypothetical protein RU99_GL000022 [Enterococcus casseliflavus]|nr:hypothetical protein RU99_GL000022 [Enterococcus casseliflavus]